MVAPNSSEETVRYDILIEAKAAMASMRDMLKYTQDNTTKMLEFTRIVQDSAARWGVSWQQALATYKQLNAELSKQKQGTLFGKTGGQDLFSQTEKYMQSLEGAGRLTDTVSQKSEQMGETTERATNRAVRGIDAMRIALGAIVAMIVFQVIQAFQQLFHMALSGLRELETATYNLANAEKTLSEQGIGITPEDLQAIISKLQELDPLLSKIQATELVSSIATRVAPQVGFNKEQIAQLSEAIAVLAVRNKGLGKSFEEVEKQVTDAFLTGKVSVAINNLGIKINDQIVKDEALRLGLVKTADEFDNLTGKMEANIKAQALLSLISANANKDLSHLPDYFKTADASFGIFQARLQDLLTVLGQKLGPALQRIFIGLADVLVRILDYIDKNQEAFNHFGTVLAIIAQAVVNLIDLFVRLGIVISSAGRKLAEVISKIPFFNELSKKLFGKGLGADTPTGTPTDEINTQTQTQDTINKAVKEGQDKLQEILKDSADKKLDIERDYQRKLADIATNYQQKLEDIARNTAQKREDALRNLNQKIEDINRDAQQKISEAQQEERKKEIDREAEFQNRLRELREKFLFDLEDALHERDARQVLRLIRQYNLDKKNLEERHKLEREQAKKDLSSKIADIEYERQKKIEAAKREYADKLEEIAIGEARDRAEANLWRSRQLADARLWYQRQLQEQQQYLQRKLRDLADALKKEYQLTAQGMSAINQLLASGYNLPAGYNPINANGAITGGSNTGNTLPSFGSTFNTLTNGAGYGFAEGGSLIATRPTKAVFGENGPEKVDITPLDRVGNNVGKTFGDKSALGMGGNVKISLELSPDLEARIVDSSLDNMAVQLEKIVRSK